MFTMGDKQNPVDIAKASIEHARENDNNIVILDTAGRLHVDESMMEELQNIKANVDVTQTISCRCYDRSGCSECSEDF